MYGTKNKHNKPSDNLSIEAELNWVTDDASFILGCTFKAKILFNIYY